MEKSFPRVRVSPPTQGTSMLMIYNKSCRTIYISDAAPPYYKRKQTPQPEIKVHHCDVLMSVPCPAHDAGITYGSNIFFSDGTDGDSQWRSQVFWRPGREIKNGRP